jgi:iron complex outermembrane receptor protein
VGSFLKLTLCLLFAAPAYAQELPVRDTPVVKDLEVVEIQAYFDSQSRHNNTRRKDGQARTERLIESLPGVGLISRGAFAQEPVIRGMSDGQINVQINGMRIFGACTDRMDPASSYIEPNNLKSIKLNTGPGFEAGAATIGGSMNFMLKEPEPGMAQKFQTSVGSGFETNGNARQFLGNWQYSGKKFAVYLNGIYRKADNYKPGGTKQDLLKSFGTWSKETGFSVDENARILYSQYEKWNAGLSAKYKWDDKNSLVGDYLTDNGYNIGYPALTMDVKYAKAQIVSLGHQYKSPGSAFSAVESKLYFNYIDHAMDDTKRPSYQVPMHMDMPGQALTAGFFSKADYRHTHHRIQVKIESFLNRWHSEMTMYPKGGGGEMFMLTIPDAQRFSTGLSVADNIHIRDQFNLLAGASAGADQSSIYSMAGKGQLSGIYSGPINRDHFLWNAYIQPVWDLSSDWQISAKLSRSMRSPTLKELYSVYLLNRVDNYEYIGNPALKKESAFNTEGSIRFNSSGFYANLKAFGYFFRNYIAGVVVADMTSTMGADGVKRYQNLSTANIWGGELTARFDPVKSLSLSSINTFQQGTDNNGNPLPLMSPFHSTQKAEWQAKSDWTFFLESLYAAGQSRVSAFYGESSTPAFNVINTGIIKAFAWQDQRLVVSLTGLNLFNQYYYEHLDVIKLPRAGRNIVAHVSFYF